MKLNNLLHKVKLNVWLQLVYFLFIHKGKDDYMEWKEQMQKYKEYAEEIKQMRENLNKIDERYKKVMEERKNGNNN